MRSVTARTILLAAMARFCEDPPGALSLIRSADRGARYSVERWSVDCPPTPRRFYPGLAELRQRLF